MKLIKPLAAIALPLTLAASLVACDGDESAAPSISAAESSSADSGSSNTIDSPAGTIVEGGSYTASIDGEPFEVTDPTTVCTDVDGDMAIAVGSTEGGPDVQGISILIGADDSVMSVAMGSTSGRNLAYAPEAGFGEATASVDGDTYTVTGSGLVADMNDPMAATLDPVPFEVSVTCS